MIVRGPVSVQLPPLVFLNTLATTVLIQS